MAQELVGNHDYDQAADIYERILRKNPSKDLRDKLNYQLAEIYYLYLSQQVNSLKYYQNVVDKVNDPIWQVKSLERIADIQFSFTRNFPESLKAYTKLIEFKPKLTNYDFYYLRIALCYIESNNYEKALPYFINMKNDSNHLFHIESFYYIGLINYYQQKWNESIEEWLEYIKREKLKDKIVKVKFLIANAYESQEKLKEAYNIYYSLLDDYPNPQIIKQRLKTVFDRRMARKR